MTLDEAIIHAESESWKNEREADRCLRHGGSTYEEKAKSCKACAEEHRQFAEWLTELKERRAKDEPTTQTETQNSNLTFKTLEYCDICDHKGCEECIANALDEHCIPSQFKKQIEDECAKEYEELGLKELKELIEAERKTESNSEKPNNCDTCKHNKLEWYSEVCDGCSKAHSNHEPKDEPTISKMEQVDEPQYDTDKGTIKCDNCSENGSYKCSKCDGEMYFKRLAVEGEPQTDCDHKCLQTEVGCEQTDCAWK